MTYVKPDPLAATSTLSSQPQAERSSPGARLRSWVSSKTFLAIIDQIVVSGTRFLTTIFIGRLCGSKELGVYALTFALYFIFSCLQEALMTTPYTVYGNRLRGGTRHALAGSVLLHAFVLSLTSAVLLGVSALALRYQWGVEQMTPAILAMAIALPFMLLWEFARKFAIAHLNLGHALALDVVTASLQLGGIAWLTWHANLSAAGGFLAWALGCGCSGLAWLFLCRRKFEFHRKQVVTDWSKHWSFGKWVLGGQIIGTLHAYTPAWVLMFAIGAAATGVFTACEQIVLLCNPLLLVIANLFGAITARAYADGGYPAVRKVVNYASIYGFTAMVVFWLALVFVGGQAVVLLYGDEFLGNGHVISTIALAAPMWAITTVMAVGLRSVEKPDTDFRARVAGLLITFIGSALAVKSWGVLAVAYALVAGSAVSALWQAYAFYCIVSDEELPSGHRESGPTRN